MADIPQQESRIKKTLLNARVNLIFYFLTLVLSFFSRKVFLDCLQAEFVGLTGTLQNLLGFLNLAELGIGASIGYVLYKPIFDHDENKIIEIISVMGYLYRIIGIVILCGGCILACFLPLIFPSTSFDYGIITFAYFSFLASSLIGYFINYRQNLLGADQRNYVVTAYFQTATIIKTLIQMTSAYYTGSYYLWIAIELIFGIIYSIILNWKINLTYPWLKVNVKEGRNYLKKYPLIIKNTKRIFLHKIGIVTQWQALPILIYAFESLKLVAFYENYSLLATKLSGMINSVLGSSEAAVGNLIAEGNNSKVEDTLWQMMSIRFWICGAVIVIMYLLIPPFIVLWLGSQFLLSDTILILIIANIGVQIVQSCLGQFIYGYGLFNDVWATLTQAAIFVTGAIIGGSLCGLPGVIASSILSISLAFGLWKPYYLYHYGFKQKFVNYWSKWIVILIQMATSTAITLFIARYEFMNPTDGFIKLVIYAIYISVVYILISSTIFLTTNKYAKTFCEHIIGRYIKRNLNK